MRKRSVFYIATLTIPIAFFVLLEGGLRLLGYGSSYPLFVELEDHPGFLYPSQDVARRYFTRQETLPTIPFDAFRKEKSEGALRIFIQGGSTAAGFPYYFSASPSDLLEDRLKATFPARDVEVISTAMAAVNSYTLVDLADEIIAEEPDAVLIYAGHNEYYGALGAASTESLVGPVWVIRSYLELSKFRTVQALRSFLAWIAGAMSLKARGEPPGATLMAKMVGEQSIPYQSPAFNRGVEQFETNLDRLVDKYTRQGIPVVVGTLGSNVRDQPPFISHPDDPDNAQSYYDRGKALLAAADSAKARTAFLDAKDRDELRFRAPEEFNRVIRSVADAHGALVADVMGVLESASPGGMIGDELMTEHLHPNQDGYFLLADAFYEALRTSHLWSEWGNARPVEREEARASMVFPALDSLLGAYRIEVLQNSWPFVPAGTSSGLPPFEAKTTSQRIARQVYTGDLGRPEGLVRLRVALESEGRIDEAVEHNLALLQRYGFTSEANLSMGDLLVAAGRPLEAMPYYEKAASIRPSQDASLSMGNILVATGNPDAAFEHYRTANEIAESAVANRMMGSILLNRGSREEAIPYLERAVALDPKDERALYNLAGAYALTRQFAEARKTVERLLEINPSHGAGRQLLDSLPPG